MCGLFGSIGHHIEKEQLQTVFAALKHRGPDEEGMYFSPNGDVVLGHVRLSIIDLNSGKQPIFNEDKSLVVICNGELYDFEKIRRDLTQKGHHFSTLSDSEIILHLYEEYNHQMYQYLRGEFAFILFDLKNSQTEKIPKAVNT